MTEMLTFLELGFRHITNVDAMDHILFLVALAAIYRIRDWRSILVVITAFTVGHSLSLVLAVTGVVRVNSAIVEFLIPLTIIATCLENLLVRAAPGTEESRTGRWRRYRPVFAVIFGLVHGAGFASYLQNLFLDHIAAPLFSFNVGIELGQVVVLAATFVLLAAIDRIIMTARGTRHEGWSPVRTRSLALSAVVLVIAAHWAAVRAPW